MAEEKKENTAKIDQEKQAKLKAKTESEEKDNELKTADAAELRKKLSNKNSDYVFRLQKELEKQGKLTTEQAREKVDALLPEIIVAQRHGQPANGLYLAAPMVKANQMLHPEVKPKTMLDIPFWQRAVDNGLFWLAIFMGMYGLLGFSNPKTQSGQNGVLTITLTGVLLGVFMAKYYEWIMPKTGSNKKPKISWPRAIGVSVALIIILVVVLGVLSQPVFRVINPVLPGIVYIIIAAIAFGVRYLFRKKYDIKISAFSGAPIRSKSK